MTKLVNPIPKPKTKKIKESKHLSRDEFELEELALALTEAMDSNNMKIFTIHRQETPLKGRVTKMDGNTKLIHIKDEMHEVHKIHFLDILTVSEVE